MSDTGGLQPVHLLALPVPLAGRAQQHFEELMREFALIAGSVDEHRDDEHQVPARLLRLVEALVQQFAGTTTEADNRLAAAMSTGADVIEDHELLLPIEAAEASASLGAMIDEADDYCRRGKHLLTLATPPDCVAYRQWYLGEVTGQLTGSAAVPWPKSSQAARLR